MVLQGRQRVVAAWGLVKHDRSIEVRCRPRRHSEGRGETAGLRRGETVGLQGDGSSMWLRGGYGSIIVRLRSSKIVGLRCGEMAGRRGDCEAARAPSW